MAKKAAIVFGVIFIIAGVWGFFSDSAIGFIAASVVSSIIHVVVGIVLLAFAGKPSISMVLKTVGIIYVIFGILGFVQSTTVLGLFDTDMTTSWFYLIVGIVIAVLGFTSKGSSSPSEPSVPQVPQM